ncbi:MAG: hypothetical protein EOO07_26965, partial [Chitinophagaceae bacterium]
METITMNPSLAFIAIILIFFGGVVVGHQYGLRREKQREFNAIAGAIRTELIDLYNPKLSKFPSISPEQMDVIFSVMSPFHRQVFHKTYTAYLDAMH